MGKNTSFRLPDLAGNRLDPESRFRYVNRPLLDPGSHPATQGLAGMTNCDTASKAVLQGIRPIASWISAIA